MITCQEVVEYLMSYLNAELAPDEVSAFKEHLAVCPECVAFLRNYNQTVRAGQLAFDTAELEPVEPVPERLVQAILAAQRQRDAL